MISVSKNMNVDKLDDIVNKYNHVYLSTTKMNLAEENSSTYTDSGIENNDKDHKFKAADHKGMAKYNNIFAKFYFPNWLEDVFVIKNLKILSRGQM